MPSTWSSWVCLCSPSRSLSSDFSVAFSRSTLDRTSRCMASLQSSRSFCRAADQPSLLSRKLFPPESRSSRSAASTMLFSSLLVATRSCCSSRTARASPSPPMEGLFLKAGLVSRSSPAPRAPAIMRSSFSTSFCLDFTSSLQRRSTSSAMRSSDWLTIFRSVVSWSRVLRSSSSCTESSEFAADPVPRSFAMKSSFSRRTRLISPLACSREVSRFRTLVSRACCAADRSFTSWATRRWAWCTALVLRPSAAARSCCSEARACRMSLKPCRSSRHSVRQADCTDSTLDWVCAISLRRRAPISNWLEISERSSAWSSWRSCLSMASPCSRCFRSSPSDLASSVMPCCSALAAAS
mmetsp:Transcript_17348/g.52082  ORF Transcript_17348/g.52082 Transcript_17348/m.52082 type:complete len:353 (+) Transcript_17348:569-1627(+)